MLHKSSDKGINKVAAGCGERRGGKRVVLNRVVGWWVLSHRGLGSEASMGAETGQGTGCRGARSEIWVPFCFSSCPPFLDLLSASFVSLFSTSVLFFSSHFWEICSKCPSLPLCIVQTYCSETLPNLILAPPLCSRELPPPGSPRAPHDKSFHGSARPQDSHYCQVKHFPQCFVRSFIHISHLQLA